MWPRAKKWLVVADWTLWELAIREGRGRGVYKGTFPSSSGSLAKFTAIRRASSRVTFPGATTKGKLGDAIRQLRVVAPCMPPEIAVTVPEGDA
jgi:hypothetical protein